MADNRSAIDKLFDIADNTLDNVESVLKPEQVPQQHPVIDVDSVSVRHREWEAQFVGWAAAHEGRGEVYHAFTPQSPIALCSKEFSAAQIRTIPCPIETLGKTIFACTRCIATMVNRG